MSDPKPHQRLCKECDKPFAARRSDHTYCSALCGITWSKRLRVARAYLELPKSQQLRRGPSRAVDTVVKRWPELLIGWM